MSARKWRRVIVGAAGKWWADNALRLGASLSFYTAFSLSPLLIIIIAVAGLVFGEQRVQEALLTQLASMVGSSGAEAVQGMLQSAQRPTQGTVATLFSVVTLLILATGVVTELQDGLNTIWHARRAETDGWLTFLKNRLLSFLLILGIGFLLIVSLVIDAGLAAVGHFLSHLLPGPEAILHLLNFVISFVVLTILFAMIFRLLPNASIGWRDVGMGSAVTTLLFTVGKLLIGLYLGKAGVGSAYGAASSLMVILLWVYYSSLILYFGAAFTFTYATLYGSKRKDQDLS